MIPASIIPIPRCACGAPVVAISPGAEPVRSETGIVVDAGEPLRGWCAACWVRRFGVAA